MCPSPQLDVKDRMSAFPRMMPLLLIEIDAFYILDSAQSLNARLLCALACKEVGCRLGEHEADRQIGVRREGIEDVGDLDSRDRAASREEEMMFAVVRVLRGYKGICTAEDICSVDIVLRMDHLQHLCDVLKLIQGRVNVKDAWPLWKEKERAT